MKQTDLRDAKQYLIGRFQLSLEESIVEAEQLGERYFDDAQEYEKRIMRITVADVKEAASLFLRANKTTAIIQPAINRKKEEK